MVPENSVIFWLTVDTLAFMTAFGISSVGFPSIRTCPCQGRYRPLITLDIVDFPLPDAPTNAMDSPLFSTK